MEDGQYVNMGFECPASVFVQAYTGYDDVEKAKQTIIDNDWFWKDCVPMKKPDLDWMLSGDLWVECMSIQLLFNVYELSITCNYMDRELNFTCDVCEIEEFLQSIFKFASK